MKLVLRVSVCITSYATAEIKSVKAHDCRLSGILFTNGGKGVVENIDIHRNEGGGQGSFTDCQISNNHLGFELRTNSSRSVQGSRLTGNANGAWKIDESSHVVGEGNTE